jgi:Lrp/AsnC family leucine-responsive transcriptional regulator
VLELDRIDIQLLAALQRDGRATNPALGENVHLSASQVSRRIQRLEDGGLIDRCVTLLRAAKVGLTVTAFTRVSLERHGEVHNDAFDRAVTAMPEVLECYSVTGPYDYQLRIVAADLEAFAQFMMHRLMRLPGVRSVESSVVLQEIKRTTELPLDQVDSRAAG